MEGNQEELIKELQGKIALLKADREDLYTKLAMAKQTIQSLHTDIGQIMEFLVDKRKDLSFIGPEYSSIVKSDDETKIHEMEHEFPNIHTLVNKEFAKVQNNNPGVSRIRLRGEALFKQVSADIIRKTYNTIDDDRLDSYLGIIWKSMSFYEKKNWIEKRVIYSQIDEPSSDSANNTEEEKTEDMEEEEHIEQEEKQEGEQDEQEQEEQEEQEEEQDEKEE